MSTFWHKMSGLGLVISNLYGDIVRKIIFLCPLRYIFEARVHFKDWKVSLKAMLSGKTQWRLMSTFWHKMSGLGLVISNLYGDIIRKIIFLCPLRYIFEARVHFKDWKVSLKAMLSGINTMTFNVNFLTQNVGPWTCYKQFIWGYCPKNHIFVPSPLHFWG